MAEVCTRATVLAPVFQWSESGFSSMGIEVTAPKLRAPITTPIVATHQLRRLSGAASLRATR